MTTYAIMMVSSYEVSLISLEKEIISLKLENTQAERKRKIHNKAFEVFANNQIKQTLNFIPIIHENIINFKNFKELRTYIESKTGRNHD